MLMGIGPSNGHIHSFLANLGLRIINSLFSLVWCVSGPPLIIQLLCLTPGQD